MGPIFELFGKIGLNTNEADRGIDGTTGKAQGAADKIAGFFTKAAAVVGAVFAVDKLIDFSKMTIEAAANSAAVQAQFQQVFSGMEKDAQAAVDNIATTAGMLPNRILPAFNLIASFAKVNGMDTAEAIGFAERATLAAADSAAFYDMSIEDATETLKSYLKGNFEVADNLGVLSTETTRNAAATELFGEKYKDLSGIQQQEVLLQMYEDANKVSGAMGQAARESEAWENQLGNAKQAWADLQAVIGGPLLELAITGLQKVTEILVDAQDKVRAAQEWFGNFLDTIANSTAFQTLREVVQEALDWIGQLMDRVNETGIWDRLAEKFKEIGQALLDINFHEVVANVGAFIDKWLPLIAAIAGGIATFKLVTGAITVFSSVMTGLSTIKHAVTGFQTAIKVFGGLKGAASALIPILTGVSLPVLGIVAAVTAAIAIGVALWQNWDTVKAKAIEIWGAVSAFFSETWTAITTAATAAWDSFTAWITGLWTSTAEGAANIWNSIKEFFTGLWTSITTGATNAWNAFTAWLTGIWQSIINFAAPIWNGLVTFISTIWQGIQTAASVAWEVIKNILLFAIGLIYTGISYWIGLVANVITTAWDTIQMMTTNVWNAISAFFTTVWQAIWGVIGPIVETIKTAITTAWDAVSSVTSSVFTAIASFLAGILNTIKERIIAAWDRIVSVTTTVWNTLSNVVKTVATAIGTAVSTAWTAIKNATTAAWNAVKTAVSTVVTAVLNVVTSIWNRVSSTTSSVWNTIKNAISNAVNAVKNTVTNVLNAIWSFISGIWNRVSSTTSSIWNGIKGTISGILNSIKSTFTNIFNSLSSAVTGAFGRVRSAVSNGMSSAWNAVTGFFGRFRDAGSNIVGSIAEGISGAIGKVTSAIGNITQKVRDFLPFSPAKEGPLRDLNRLNFGGTISEGIYKGRKAVQEAMDDILEMPDLEAPELYAAETLTGSNYGRSSYAAPKDTSTSGGISDKIGRLADKIDAFVANAGKEPVYVQIDGRTIAVATRDPLDQELQYKSIDDDFSKGRRNPEWN